MKNTVRTTVREGKTKSVVTAAPLLLFQISKYIRWCVISSVQNIAPSSGAHKSESVSVIGYTSR